MSYMVPFAALILMMMGMCGIVIRRHNMISIVLCVELMLLGAQSYGVWLAYVLKVQAIHAWVLAIMVVSAVETVLALSIIIALYQGSNKIDSDDYAQLKD